MRQVVGDVPLGGSPFPPIADYAFLSDCESARSSRRAATSSGCACRASTARRLRRDARPRRRLVPGRRRSTRRCPPAAATCPGTMVLETTWGTRTGWVIVRDVLLDRALAPRRRALDTRTAARRPTTTPTTSCCARCAASTAASRSRWSASRRSTTARKRSPGSTAAAATARRSARAEGERRRAAPDDRPAPRLRGRRAPARARRCATATPRSSRCRGPSTRRPRPTTRPTSGSCYTADFWHEWLSHGEFPDHPWRTYLQRSALTLKGLTYAPTGAMIAAATTSLPETPGGERNWDYRYTWIRDSTFMLWGLLHARLRRGGQRLLLLHRATSPRATTTCRSCTASAASAS